MGEVLLLGPWGHKHCLFGELREIDGRKDSPAVRFGPGTAQLPMLEDSRRTPEGYR